MNQSIATNDASGQSLLLQRLRWQVLRNTMTAVLRGSLLRAAIIVGISAIIWIVVFIISKESFGFLKLQKLSLFGGIVGTIFDLFFLALTILLIFSSGLILYSSLFSSAETAFLLSTPARADHVFAYKYQAALGFSSWGFLLLGSPVLVAYGLANAAPWHYYGLLLLFFLGFVLLPGAIGALICLAIVNFLPRQRRQLLSALGVIAVIGLGFWVRSLRPPSLIDANYVKQYPDFLQRVLGQLSFAQGPLAPNHWMTRGLVAAARGDFEVSSYCLALVWSNSLFLYVATAWLAKRLYRRGYNRVWAGGQLRRRYSGHWLDRALSGLVFFLDPQTKLLIVKDFRTFRRDPAQWAQVLIFLGLICLYFSNMRRFYQEDIGRNFQNGVSIINLVATSLLLCSYTGRFIYPMLSLEGQKFWVLGLLPLRRERLLWGKFAFSATWSLLTAEFLIVFSDLMLGMPAFVVVTHALAVAVLALGLSGISVGLGAWMPNFRESDPSKIAVGFGGTLNLVAGLLFLLVVILTMAAPAHLRLAYPGSVAPDSYAWLLPGTVLGLLAGAIAVIVPLRLGARALRDMEF